MKTFILCTHPLPSSFTSEPVAYIWFHRKALLLASGILVAGGTATYLQSRFSRRKPDSFAQYNGVEDNEAKPGKGDKDGINQKKSKPKKGGSKSLKVLAAILLSEMGQLGARDLLALVGIVVSFWHNFFLLWCFVFLIFFPVNLLLYLARNLYILYVQYLLK